MTFFDISLYFAAAAAASAINAVAGGGTFLVFPVLILNGMSPLVANIMSSIALWPGSVASTIAYTEERRADRTQLRPFLMVSIIGSALGTWILLTTPEVTFEFLVPWLMLFATLLFTFGKHGFKWLNQTSPDITAGRRFAGLFLQFAIAVYGGYFGAGIGILMLAMLQVMGFTQIHRMNAVKMLLGSTINAVAFFVFLFSGRVIWPVAIIMIAGAILGGYVGARTALKVDPQKIRILVSTIGFAMTAYFFIHGV